MEFRCQIDGSSIKICPLGKNKLDTDRLRENYKEFIRNNGLILKSRQRFRSNDHNVFTEEINKIALSAKDDKKYNQSIQ